jgi:hypothetical protein
MSNSISLPVRVRTLCCAVSIVFVRDGGVVGQSGVLDEHFDGGRVVICMWVWCLDVLLFEEKLAGEMYLYLFCLESLK